MLANRPPKRQSLFLTLAVALGIPLASPIACGQERASVPSNLQDNTVSPSDSLRLSDPDTGAQSDSPSKSEPATQATPSDNGFRPTPIQDSISDQIQPQPSPPTNTPNRITPQVSQLGDGAYSNLTRSNFYASPFALALGVGANGARNASLGQYFGSAAHRSLQDTPEMFGDFRRPGASIFFDSSGALPPQEPDYPEDRPRDFPGAASFSGLRVSENNVALPQDRVWFSYNHLHNAFAQPGGDLSLDRFTLGVEKTFDNGSSSVEVRLPMAGSIDPAGSFGGTTVYSGGSFGNLSLLLKRVLVATDTRVLAVGLAVETPTGSRSHALDYGFGVSEITISPNAVYLTPYLGTLRKIDDIWFINSFLQVDIPTAGERLSTRLNGVAQPDFYLNKPTMLQVDLGGGVWLITPNRNRVGIAVSSELHIATALTPADSFTVVPGTTQPNVFVNQDATMRNLVNSTTGIHAQLNREWSLRTALSVPLLNQRIFDTEVMVQLNRNF